MNNIITKYKSYEQLLTSARSTMAVLGGAVYRVFRCNISKCQHSLHKKIFVYKKYISTLFRERCQPPDAGSMRDGAGSQGAVSVCSWCMLLAGILTSAAYD